MSSIVTKVSDGIGWITLSRPKALNALNLQMIRELHQTLVEWVELDEVESVVVLGSGDRAFCAGGDLRSVYEAHIAKDHHFFDVLFREEYTLNYIIKTYPKPYLAFINGIAMGGGLGLSVNGQFCIVSEKAHLAMPEVSIGYFPDVGGSYFLNTMPGRIGYYLGLTGSHFSAGDAVFTNLSSYYIHSERWSLVFEILTKLEKKSPQNIRVMLENFTEDAPPSKLKEKQEVIDRCFNKPTLEGILKALKCDSDLFALETYKQILTKSPLSICVTFEQLQRCKDLPFDAVMQEEFRLSRSFVKEHDFFEGIRAAIIDKDRRPRWQPALIEQVTSSMIEVYFHHHDFERLPI